MFHRLHGSRFPPRRWASLLLLLFSLVISAPLVSPSATAAPLLIDEEITPGQPWLNDIPEAAAFNDGIAEAPVASAGRALRRPTRTSSLAPPVEMADGFAQVTNASLKELVRSYINTKQSVNEVAGGTIWGSQRPGNFADRAFTTSSRSGADEMLANVVTTIVQPAMSSSGMMTFSILGLGEFTLVGKRDGLSLALGDALSFALLGSSDDDASLHGPSAMGLTMRDTDMAPSAPEGLYASSAAWSTGDSAGLAGESGRVAGSSGRGGAGGEWQNQPRQVTKMFALAFDILTYPGTLLILLMVLLLPLIKEENKYRKTKFRPGRQLKMRRKPQRRRKRGSAQLTVPSSAPVPQRAVE